MPQEDPYSKEKAKPEIPACGKSTAAIHFSGSFLALVGGGKSFAYPAVSGKPDAKRKFDNSEERQKQKGVGPIPQGDYWISPEDLWENAWYKSGSTSGWGNYRITLRVYPGTETHGRGGFFIHGGSVAGSAGCIDLTSKMDQFVADMKVVVGATRDCFIPVRVRYST